MKKVFPAQWIYFIYAPLFVFFISSKSLALVDVNYTFDVKKVEEARSPFYFLRSFVDYFYLLVASNEMNLPSYLSNKNGVSWCVGDAHPENFGTYILENNQSTYTMNDIDDSGPCPLVLDILRLMVSSRLYNPSVQLSPMIQSYLRGLRFETIPAPGFIQKMLGESLSKGKSARKKNIEGRRLVRQGDFFELNAEQTQAVVQILMDPKFPFQPGAKITDVYGTRKQSGGSADLTRFEVLIENGNDFIQLEFKQQTAPAVAALNLFEIPQQQDRIFKSLTYTQNNPSSFFQFATVLGMPMLIRPIFSGNIGTDLADIKMEELQSVLNYQALTLGRIHASSSSNLPSYINGIQRTTSKAWESDVQSFVQMYEAKFQQLKGGK